MAQTRRRRESIYIGSNENENSSEAGMRFADVTCPATSLLLEDVAASCLGFPAERRSMSGLRSASCISPGQILEVKFQRRPPRNLKAVHFTLALVNSSLSSL